MRTVLLLLVWIAALSVQAETVWLAWTNSRSPNVVSYKVYSGPYSQIYNQSATTTNLLWSTNLPPDSTHYFAVTAVSKANLESAFSNEVSWHVAPTNQPPTTNPIPGEVTIDNQDAGFVGTWQISTKFGGFIGPNYAHDNNEGKGTKKAVFKTPDISGRYQLSVYYPAQKGNTVVCSKVPVTVISHASTNTVFVNQAVNTSEWNALGIWTFMGGTNEGVVFDNINPGQVTVDAVRFTPAP